MDLKGIELTWLGHGAVRLRLGDGTTVLIDAWLQGNPACPADEVEQDRVDAIYVTHGHGDHFSGVPDIARAHEAPVHAIHEISLWLAANGVSTAVGSNKGGTVPGPGGIEATMVEAVHSSGIDFAEGGVADGGQAAGWVLAVPDGPTVYHAGDTDVFGDMALIGELHRPDIALLPIGGYFTMGPIGAARAARLLGVATVVPIHFGTFPILAGTPEQLREAAAGDFEVIDCTPAFRSPEHDTASGNRVMPARRRWEAPRTGGPPGWSPRSGTRPHPR